MKNLFEVNIKKTDTCLTYVLRRIGADKLIDKITYDNLHEHFDFKSFERSSQEKLKLGQIFLWDRTMELVDLPWSIDQNGTILWHKVGVGYHFAVYEGNDMFSDCSRLERNPHPSLRMRRFSDLKKMPDHILTLL